MNAVANICARLDGIPLAIELAAARVRVLSVEDIVKRLDDRFRLLVGLNTTLPRQRTLRALIDWSYELLTENERSLLRRLAVFTGGWTLEAAEQVCSGHGIEDWEVLDLLTGLIDKSFVLGETRHGHQRYRFLETIQKFSQEQLLESHESEIFTHKYASYYLTMTVSSYGKEWGPEQAIWLMWLDEEYDNLRTALDWLSQASGNEEQLLQMAGSLWRYWEIRGYLTEGRAWLDTALAKSSKASSYWRANGLGGAGHLARQQGDYMQAQALHEQSLKLFRQLGHELDTARQLNALGEIAHFHGDYELAVELHEESRSLREEIGDKEGIAVSLRQLGVIARDRGQYEYAKELLEESLKLERELSDKLYIALSLNDLGLVSYHLCDYERADSLFEEAIFMQREVNDRLGISNSLQNLGNVAKDQGDFKRAVSLYKECLVLKQALGDKRGLSRVIVAQAEVAFLQGKYSLAAALAMQSLSISQDLGLKRSMLAAFELLGFIAYYQWDLKTAASYAEKSVELSTELNAPQAIGYAKLLLALGKYGEGSMEEARDTFQEALVIIQDINDCRSVAGTYVNLAKVAYCQRDYDTAHQYLEDSLVISLALKISWFLGFVYETRGVLQCSEGNFEGALISFQESLRISVEQENDQRIYNCLMALAGLAVVTYEERRAVRLFAAAAKLRHDMGVKININDRVEYERQLALVHERLDLAAFETEWSEGFSMTTQEIMEDLKKSLDEIGSTQLPEAPADLLETPGFYVTHSVKQRLTKEKTVISEQNEAI